MLLNQQIDTDVISVQKSGDFKIDQASMGIIMKGFADALYSNKIGSLIREIVSNAVDANIESGSPEPVIVELESSINVSFPKFKVIDFGIGINADRMENIFSAYFSSTKRDNNDQIGGWGLGSKSPLSYVQSFEIYTRYDGSEYHYIIHRGVNCPKWELIGEEPTDEPSGTTILIPYQEKDKHTFIKEIQSQLKYFDNIFYQGHLLTDLNNFKVFHGTHFVYRPDSNESYLHACIGKVNYKLDFNVLELRESRSSIYCPVALKFEIGEVSVTMNRESIEYSPEVIATIHNKYNKAVSELLNLYHKNRGAVTEDFELWVKLSNEKKWMLSFDTDNKLLINIEAIVPDLIKSTYTPIKFKAFGDLPIVSPKAEDVFTEIAIRGRLEDGKVLAIRNPKGYGRGNRHFKRLTFDLLKNYSIYRVSTRLNPKKNMYIEDANLREVALVTNDPVPNDQLKWLIINGNPPCDIKDACLAAYRKEVLRYLVQNSIKYENVVIPDDFAPKLEVVKASRQKRGTIKDTDDVFIYFPYSGGSYTRNIVRYSKFVEVSKLGGILVIGERTDNNLKHLAAISLEFDAPPLGTRYSDPSKIRMANTKGFMVFNVAKDVEKEMRKDYRLRIMTPDEFIKHRLKWWASAEALKEVTYSRTFESLLREFPLVKSLYSISRKSPYGEIANTNAPLKEWLAKHNYTAINAHYDDGHKVHDILQIRKELQEFEKEFSVLRMYDYKAIQSKEDKQFLINSLKFNLTPKGKLLWRKYFLSEMETK